MNTIDIEKLNQLISRTDISGNIKVRWLTDFIDGRELQQQETLYSEEDLKEAFNKGFYTAYGCKSEWIERIEIFFKEWFEQFKNNKK